MSAGTKNLLSVRGLTKHFPIRGGVFGRVHGHVRAVDGIDFDIGEGETYALVGESGCGKSTTGQTLLRLIEPTAGTAHFDGRNIFELDPRELRTLRRQMQIVFQDPYSALNPRKTVEAAIAETLSIHGIAHGRDAREKARDVLERCGLARYHGSRYPHEFSGGQRQRVVIARALALDPRFVVADEPVSALDVSIQSQIVNLMKDLQRDFSLTYLFISHDLAVVKHTADRIGVMYLGNLVEEAPRDELFRNPQHPYTQALISAIPPSNPWTKRKRIVLKGDVPSPANPPTGCPFHTRCPYVMEVCRTAKPELRQSAGGHRVACHLVHPHDAARTPAAAGSAAGDAVSAVDG
ncbi:MAG: dipeptide ABC transporter ATP-binding protein [Spirochaetales bacterium]|nr:dipeptide ABC transporter ATP-binding protein [Spirochaetales bacterium]